MMALVEDVERGLRSQHNALHKSFFTWFFYLFWRDCDREVQSSRFNCIQPWVYSYQPSSVDYHHLLVCHSFLSKNIIDPIQPRIQSYLSIIFIQQESDG